MLVEAFTDARRKISTADAQPVISDRTVRSQHHTKEGKADD